MAKGALLTLVREWVKDKDDKLAPQQQVIYDYLADKEKGRGVGKTVSRAQLIKDIEESGKMTTRQTVDRILAYYLNHFKKIGMIKVSDSDEPAAAGGDKPKKGKKDKDTSPANSSEAKPEKDAGEVNAPAPEEATA